MNFSLIICTYMRPGPLLTLLESVGRQTLLPSEILVIDGSTDDKTRIALKGNANVHYFKVSDEDRGLTKQRNYGIERVAAGSEVVCFLDDDTVLEPEYFGRLIGTYADHPEALAVGGYITNEDRWEKAANDHPSINEFQFDGWKRKDGSRFVMRKKLGLDADLPPGFLPEFSHGRSIAFLPPSGKTFRVEQLMGGVSSFRKSVFSTFRFSEYFEGYGLYEDADFTFRLSKAGPLFVNTAARLAHYHDSSGRPNQYRYGKMVVRNGWYVWRVRHPDPSFGAKVKWHAITILLAAVRLGNVITTTHRYKAFSEGIGRLSGWLSLFIRKPK